MVPLTNRGVAAFIYFLSIVLPALLPAGLMAQAKGAAGRPILAIPSQAMSMMPIFVAADRGFFQEQGVDPLIVYVAGRLQPPAMASGDVDYSASAETAKRAAIQGMPLKVVAYMSSKLSVSLVGAAEIKSVRELKGRTIAVTSLGGSLDYLAREIVSRDGLNPDKEVRVVALNQNDAMLALDSGSIHAAMLVPPFDAIMSRKGFRRLVFAGDLMDYPQGGLATTDKKIKENPAEVKRMIRAIVKSLFYINGNRDPMIGYIGHRWKIDRELASSSYETMVRSFSPDGTASAQSIQNVIESTRARLKLQRAVPLSEVVNLSLLEQVHRDLGLK
ncbi:MAG: ABC transporter substrate-binding protein [Deltaproteobacteria bacterium]|nr:ABC transporter substrate-binding protein [Deltaproteobacteria bacterium]